MDGEKKLTDIEEKLANCQKLYDGTALEDLQKQLASGTFTDEEVCAMRSKLKNDAANLHIMFDLGALTVIDGKVVRPPTNE